MRLRLPNIEQVPRARSYAPRPPDLRGRRIGVVDGWGQKLPDGTMGMYPTMEELLRLLKDEYQIGEHVWIHKENVSRPVSEQVLDGLAKEVEVVLNGQGL